MKASQSFLATLKEAPSDAEVVSHKLMVRAGLIRKLSAGIYNYLPLGLKVIRKVENIIREEMNRAGAIELLMPMIQPAELWQETGRWEKMGPELLRIKDRHERDFLIQPTSEEVITDLARNEIKSYKQLPINFYQIQTKFRDERRPRFGIMRGREFSMKDAYSFDRDVEGLKKSYQIMFNAYTKIFQRMGLKFRAVTADNGAIGGSGSQEFHVIADTGEDAIVYCPSSDYAANLEAAVSLPLLGSRAAAQQSIQKVVTPTQTNCAEVANFLSIPIETTVKSLLFAVDQEKGPAKLFMLLLRGDHDLNEVKASKVPGMAESRFATEAEIKQACNAPAGYLGPVGIAPDVKVVADHTVANMSDFVCGANLAGHHLTGVNWGRDLPEPLVMDLRNAVIGDPSPDGKGVVDICRGIEVGHVFQLGTRYSEAMGCTYLDQQGKSQPMVMGCYGIGVTRLLGAAIEQGHDERGIIWPISMAPFEVVICPMNYDKSEQVKAAADQLHEQLIAAGIDVILDDRGERPGAMFADWELIGAPFRVVIGERGLVDAQVEFKGRTDAESQNISITEIKDKVIAAVNSAKQLVS
ncbi:proline--tRNA ligase [Polynucleobacter paneuropaeus]|uniref:Proline--tRNA ligase n=1 Tax=Polynucleobacter paneuropaeus TaxID=2527775 RepID=A0AAE2YLI7_9BURK|nr:proline--tRNA ligase [Polynucleobacter paneuropaeus]MBT8521976.1 proline--tRNA ligase [Polynucleobacter paneuropaeus]MBT8539336.1 proline--tRNA ligase [Polynucleobacter paneuropaeus]MBT8588913.1 proline--tRNA ligase [Polynucleobacter paneuropaeus]MBT8591716.1 proline--tRNA ligase [Polynucleobacter paneuropaeus]MBT8597106.1 proline--tRNA ligase [Polynucleobacter paneuropaeus]